jgi:CRISPR-associated protein Cmr6
MKTGNLEVKLPEKVSQIVISNTLDNLYLLHYRLFNWNRNNNKPESLLRKRCIQEKKKRVENIKPIKCNDFKLNLLLNKLNARTKALASSYENGIEPYTYTLLDKLAIGIGEASPWDSLLLMTLHPLYGVPYLPATAIKGMLRGYWEQAGGGKEEAKEIFGSGEEMGKLIFFDIFPNKFTLDFDVMTPHFGDYYEKEGKIEPTDDKAPNIITFPVIKNASFDVYIACQDEALWKKYSAQIYEGLKNAFKYNGIGAKTALGYGLGK